MTSKLDFSKELIGRRALVTGDTRGISSRSYLPRQRLNRQRRGR